VSHVLTTDSAEETRALGWAIGAAIDGPLLVLLHGDYGTGKTTFVQGLAGGLGCTELPRSPSYLIVRVHGDGRRGLVHADLYRVLAVGELSELGLDELAGSEGVIAVEWPGEADWLTQHERPALELTFSYVDVPEDSATLRRIEASWNDNLPPAIIRAIDAARPR
jgi:tRNA threonylcarbamoyladenosine biosynthesis protein TsaE